MLAQLAMLTVSAVSLGLILVHLRKIRKARASLEENLVCAERYLEHAVLLDRVLTDLCAKSCCDAHLPIWAAWAATMGHFEVELTVKAEREAPR